MSDIHECKQTHFFLLVGFEKFKYVASLHMDGGRQNKSYVSDYTDEGTRSFVD